MGYIEANSETGNGLFSVFGLISDGIARFTGK
jgi:hypothetical protein